MDLRHLTTFRMVATQMSFSRAAVALDYAQSTVTAHIQALESDMDVRLFNRIGKHIELTDAGERLLRYSEKLLDLAEETRQVVTQEGDLNGTLTIGAPETVVTYRLPQVLRRFREQCPDVRLIFRPLRYEQLYSSVKQGTVDVAFLLEQSINPHNLHIETLTREPLVIVSATDNPLAHQRNLSLQELSGESILFTERGCGYRGMFERVLRAEGVIPTSNMEFDSVEAIKQCVIANVGVAVLPYVVVAKEIQNESLVALDWTQPDFAVHTQMLWHQDKWVSSAMQQFIDISRSILNVKAQEA